MSLIRDIGVVGFQGRASNHLLGSSSPSRSVLALNTGVVAKLAEKPLIDGLGCEARRSARAHACRVGTPADTSFSPASAVLFLDELSGSMEKTI